jgi:hypothetical protein
MSMILFIVMKLLNHDFMTNAVVSFSPFAPEKPIFLGGSAMTGRESGSFRAVFSRAPPCEDCDELGKR